MIEKQIGNKIPLVAVTLALKCGWMLFFISSHFLITLCGTRYVVVKFPLPGIKYFFEVNHMINILFEFFG